jgi:hypothetical protein
MKVTLLVAPWDGMEEADQDAATALHVHGIAIDGRHLHFSDFSFTSSGDAPFGHHSNNGDFLVLRLRGVSDYMRLILTDEYNRDEPEVVIPVSSLEIALTNSALVKH